MTTSAGDEEGINRQVWRRGVFEMHQKTMRRQERVNTMPVRDNLARTDRDRMSEPSERAVALCVEAVQTAAQGSERHETIFAELDEMLDQADDELVRLILQSERYRAIRRALHRVRAEYEYEREFLLAQDILRAGSESPALAFRSASWYEQATSFEMKALAPYRLERMLFVGSGPFPTTPFSYMRADPELSVTCLDREPRASAVALKVADILGFHKLNPITSDVLDFTDFGNFDCAIIGLVVGTSDAEKARIVRHLKRVVPPSTLLVFRTAVGSGAVIYPAVELSLFDDTDWRILTGPPHKSFTLAIINSVESES